jgi:acyl-coenzyme A thioesterase PaaI-like protein
MTTSERIAQLNERRPPFIELLDGRIIATDDEQQSCTFAFHPTKDHCHSVDVVQGGFITVMLDAAMSHAVFAHLGPKGVVALSSYEVTTRYHAVTRGGQGAVLARGWIRQATYKTVFLESELRSEAGELLATAQSVAKIVRNKA